MALMRTVNASALVRAVVGLKLPLDHLKSQRIHEAKMCSWSVLSARPKSVKLHEELSTFSSASVVCSANSVKNFAACSLVRALFGANFIGSPNLVRLFSNIRETASTYSGSSLFALVLFGNKVNTPASRMLTHISPNETFFISL